MPEEFIDFLFLENNQRNIEIEILKTIQSKIKSYSKEEFFFAKQVKN